MSIRLGVEAVRSARPVSREAVRGVGLPRGVAVAFALLPLLALLPLVAAPSAAQDDSERIHPFRMRIAFAGGRERFHRGGVDPASPVKDLVVTVTLTNPSEDLAVSLLEPRLRAHGGPEFAVFLLGAPTGVAKTDDTPARTPVKRNPAPVPVGLRPELPEVTLKPGESKQFDVNVGSWYDITQAGRYEMSCTFEEERSNSVTFEVLPLKVTNVRARTLVSRIDDFERGGPRFPFMFYIAHGEGRFDEIVYLVRRGRGADEHFESRRLAEVKPGTVPEMITSPDKVGLVGLLCPDKRSPRKSRLFVVDFGRRPLKVTGEVITHEAGMVPTLVVKPDGGIGVSQ